MTNKELYQHTFSQTCSKLDIRLEDMEKRYVQRWKTLRRVLIFAAVICLLAAFSTAAVANDWFGLRRMELQQEIIVTEPDGTPVEVTVPSGTITLQGYMDMPESRAFAEWQSFLGGYDVEGLLEQLGNDPSGFEEEYALYRVYSQEMADKLEEILKKYKLNKHREMFTGFVGNEAVCAQAGGDFLGENKAFSAYFYEDGTFKFDGLTELANFGLLEYQFMRCVRGSFTDVRLNIGDVGEYREWSYSTACEIPVVLALGPRKALVIADLPQAFVTVHVLAGTEAGGLTPEHLEQFADGFDFSVLSPVQMPTGENTKISTD